MNFKTTFLLIGILVYGSITYAQAISGNIYEMQDGRKIPLAGTNIYQLNTTNGTTSDENGKFSLKLVHTGHEILVFSYVGYVNDTLHLHDADNKKIDVLLREQTELDQVEIISSQRGNYVSRARNSGIQLCRLCKRHPSFA